MLFAAWGQAPPKPSSPPPKPPAGLPRSPPARRRGAARCGGRRAMRECHLLLSTAWPRNGGGSTGPGGGGGWSLPQITKRPHKKKYTKTASKGGGGGVCVCKISSLSRSPNPRSLISSFPAAAAAATPSSCPTLQKAFQS